MPRGLSLEDMRSRADRTLAGSSIADAHDRFRNLVGPLPDEMTDLAHRAYDELRNGEHPSDEALHALEIAIRMHRPAVPIHDGAIGALPDEAKAAFPDWASFADVVKAHVGSVGRLASKGELVGTGFLIGSETVVTNRHVVDALSDQAQFDDAAVHGVVARHPELDLAIVAVDPQTDRQPLPISETPPPVGTTVAAIGFPDRDPRCAGFDRLLFADGFGVLRASPGEVTGQHGDMFFHDCSTLGGSSGSPVVSLATQRVVGVHADGFFLARNEAIEATSALQFFTQYRR
jgi:S1-C subfamily serine protease